RSWAKKNGQPVSDRGRIAASVQRAYDEAQKS
ncbi:MAG: histone-like nucleoid-structuring protein Lsr2, partial [Dermatophilaceae bacterium]